jgi:hypothetical protein
VATTAISYGRRRRLVRAFVATGAAAAGFTAIVGLLHTPYGRPIMARLGIGCPAKRVSPAEAEALRMQGVRELRGTKPSPARPALGFALDVSREDDVGAWIRAYGLRCDTVQRPSWMVRCAEVPAAAFSRGEGAGTIDEVSFAFAPDGRLVSVQTFWRALNADEASRLFTHIAKKLASTLGSEGERTGTATPAFLGAGSMQTARVSYRYSDYLATVTAMNLDGRIGLREQYQSAIEKG